MGFFGALLGSDQRKAIKSSTGSAMRTLKGGKDTAVSNLRAARTYTTDAYKRAVPLYDEAIESYQPYVESGTKANQMYSDAIGVNGGDARGAAQDVYNSDPMLKAIAEQEQNAVIRQMAARGTSGARHSALTSGRVALGSYGSWLDRLKGQGEMGFTATNGMNNARLGKASFEMGYGDRLADNAKSIADLSYGHAGNIANLKVGRGNALAEAASIPVNNFFKLNELGIEAGKVAASFFGGKTG